MSATTLSPRAAVALGLVFIAAGILLALISVGVVRGAGTSLEAPRWVGACAGVMFALCGGAVIVGYAWRAAPGRTATCRRERPGGCA